MNKLTDDQISKMIDSIRADLTDLRFNDKILMETLEEKEKKIDELKNENKLLEEVIIGISDFIGYDSEEIKAMKKRKINDTFK